ncbi:MAG: hypothetical protein ACLFVT_07265 [Syntrophobacteria bacterium]
MLTASVVTTPLQRRDCGVSERIPSQWKLCVKVEDSLQLGFGEFAPGAAGGLGKTLRDKAQLLSHKGVRR